MMPMMLAMILGSSTSGQFVSRRGKYWFNALIGALVASCGLALMLLLGMNATLTQVVVAVVVMGAGFGVSNSLYSTIVQNAVPFSKMGQAHQLGYDVAPTRQHYWTSLYGFVHARANFTFR